jgi:nucleotide-binding universal stress UspA family protein
MRNVVLLAVDGSRWGEAALPHAVALASRLEASLALVRAVHPRVLPGHDVEAARAAAAAAAHGYLTGIAAAVQAAHPQLEVQRHLRFGPPAEAILEVAAASGVSIIVLATRGHRSTTIWGVGRTADMVAHRSDVPVLLVRPTRERWTGGAGEAPLGTGQLPEALAWSHDPLRVLIPVDGTPVGEAVLPLLVSWAARFPVLATVLHVRHRPRDAASGPPGLLLPAFHLAGVAAITPDAAPGPWYAAEYRGLGTRLAIGTYCHQVVDWLRRHGVRARCEIRDGDIAEELVRAAHAEADLIAVGMRARGGVTRWAVDSVAERLMRTARCPVLAVRTYRQHSAMDDIWLPQFAAAHPVAG